MAVKKNKQSMAEKVVIQRKDNEMASRIVGTIFIVVGVILVGLGIYSFVTYNVEPELDEILMFLYSQIWIVPQMTKRLC
jgi:hypothetical protein